MELIDASIRMDIKNLRLGHLHFWALSKTTNYILTVQIALTCSLVSKPFMFVISLI